ncbi:cell division initiation protein [Streptomyces sp. NPDC021100]|uniref:cell division initiation protein n=1 Tax=Streptomyces sp. NPDC021100 TaxID=3365114 RepID=UPI0037B61603
MDVQKKLDEIVATVAGARSLPMSASCVVNRAELLGLLEEVRAALPDSLAQAREVIGGRERMVADAREEAERIIESARAQRGSLISDTEVARESREEADRILAEARREAAEIRAQADDYVDGKLANFEVVLTKTRGSVERGREKLLGLGDGSGFDDPEGPGADVPERSGDPATQRRNADAYVDAKLTAVSAVLAKTLEAVGRGREKLLGARPADELGAHLAAQDGRPAEHPATDADFLAELAAHPAPAAGPRSDWPPQVPHQEPAPEPVQETGYGWQPYPGQTDPYAVGGAGGGHTGQETGYGWPAQDAGQQAYGHGHGHGHGYGQGYDQGYGQGPAQGYPPAPPRQDAPLEGVVVPPQGGGALDETSFFDTSMIDLEQLRRYEQGR